MVWTVTAGSGLLTRELWEGHGLRVGQEPGPRSVSTYASARRFSTSFLLSL